MANPGFFERQANARRNTLLLILLFSVAVVLIALSVCLVGYLVTRGEDSGLRFDHWLLGSHGLATAGAVVVLILAGSLIRWMDLAGGGERVAKMVNARELDPSSRDADERRLRNVVEEMAIASGIPVPRLYVMDNEHAINAFVAGYSPNEAVMVMTRGALTELNRDELQGVVGHEFSHILNGDMRINVRLIALLAGILTIGQIGFFLLRGASVRHHVSSSRNRNNGQAILLLVGVALAAIGYVGVFFGRLIQAAVSRERERLADASSVQFTRNPEGIGGALYKIGLGSGYLESTSHASDMNHMCFGESTRMAFSRLLGSHPPIDERINAIQPGLLSRLKVRFRDQAATTSQAAANPSDQAIRGFASGASAMASTGVSHGRSQPMSQRVGTVTPANEDYAVALLRRLPPSFRDLLYTRTGAVQLCWALLTRDMSNDERSKCLWQIPDTALMRPQPEIIDRLLPTLVSEGDVIRFPALELAMPILRQLDPEEKQLLIRHTGEIIRADGRVTLFELALFSFLKRHLDPDAGRTVSVRYRSYRKVSTDLEYLFSLVARAASKHPAEAEKLYQEALASFMPGQGTPPGLHGKITVKQLQASLARLNQLSPMLKPAIIDACGYCILHDGHIDVREYELVRLIADQLDCPLPPLSTA